MDWQAIEDNIVLVCAILSGVLAPVPVVLLGAKLRQRHVRAHIVVLCASASLLGALALATVLFLWLSRGPLSAYIHSHAPDNAPVLLASLCFLASSSIAMDTLVHRIQPRPKTSIRGGPRKGWLYAALGVLTAAAGLAGFGLFERVRMRRDPTAWDDGFAWFFLGFIYLVMGTIVLLIYRRTRRLDKALASDTRPPVLYVRVFKEEERPFGDVTQPFWLSPIARSSMVTSLERYLTRAVERELGPFVALGNPEDIVEPLEGAARKYFAAEEWRAEFQRLASTCSATHRSPRGSAPEA